MAVLKESIEAVPDGIPVILDFKRSDIGNTAAMYARSAFEYYGVDAVTVNPYLGIDSIEPLTSNRSSSELQRQLMLIDEVPSMRNLSPQAQAKTIAEFFRYSTIAVYTHIARLAMEWNVSGNIGLVVGATSPKELEKIRQLVGDKIPILIPGVGAQGGDLESAVKLGSNSKGNLAIINVSRSIVYSQGGESFPEAVREKAISYREAIYDIAAQKRAK
jgi:orotidine-5'-phosphate decarboxylase